MKMGKGVRRSLEPSIGKQNQQCFTIRILFASRSMISMKVWVLQAVVLSLVVPVAQGYCPPVSTTTKSSCHPQQQRAISKSSTSRSLGPFGFFSGSSGASSTSSIPKSTSDRDKQAIEAVKAAIEKPKTTTLPLIECEFPPLESLNKLGDGSLRSANLVDDANLAFGAKLVKGLSSFIGPKVWFLTSTTSSPSFLAKAAKTIKGAQSVQSLRQGIPEGMGEGDICIIMAPSVRQDYLLARSIATTNPAVVINGLAKDQKSIGGEATMAYFLKPLTYNSQIIGYLARKYPNDWTTVDLVSNKVLSTYSDSEILFGKTNTPDLRDPGRRVQKAVDERAIQARQR